MLARPEPGSRAHILLWLASMPATGTFGWTDPEHCACGQYCAHAFGNPLAWYEPRGGDLKQEHPALYDMNRVAGNMAGPTSERRITFGRLEKAMRAHWKVPA